MLLNSALKFNQIKYTIKQCNLMSPTRYLGRGNVLVVFDLICGFTPCTFACRLHNIPAFSLTHLSILLLITGRRLSTCFFWASGARNDRINTSCVGSATRLADIVNNFTSICIASKTNHFGTASSFTRHVASPASFARTIWAPLEIKWAELE